MTQERQDHNSTSPWWGEHMHRYKLCLNYFKAENKRVLDIACGNGYGSYFIYKNGFDVIGADISISTIINCKKNYIGNNLTFDVVDGTNMPYKNAEFDYLISFETIEHTKRFNELLSEFKRVVKKNKLIILSTPNFIINSPKGYIENKFHTQEWDFDGINKLLSEHFNNYEIFGQTYVRYKKIKTMRFKLAKLLEDFFYLRGVRKLPLKIQDRIMKQLIGLPLYPTDSDFDLVNTIEEIKKCKTFFIVCKT